MCYLVSKLCVTSISSRRIFNFIKGRLTIMESFHGWYHIRIWTHFQAYTLIRIREPFSVLMGPRWLIFGPNNGQGGGISFSTQQRRTTNHREKKTTPERLTYFGEGSNGLHFWGPNFSIARVRHHGFREDTTVSVVKRLEAQTTFNSMADELFAKHQMWLPPNRDYHRGFIGRTHFWE